MVSDRSLTKTGTAKPPLGNGDDMLNDMTSRQFSLIDLFIMMGLVSMYLVMRRVFLSTPHHVVGAQGFHFIPPFFACLVGLIQRVRNPAATLQSSAILGFFVAGIVATALAIEIAIALQRMNYWNGPSLTPVFSVVLLAHAAVGSFLSFIIGVLFQRPVAKQN